jgi:hypothetical protein
MVILWFLIIKELEDIKSSVRENIFDRLSFMTRYGRIGYEEAKRITNWERHHYMQAVGKLIDEEAKKFGGLMPLMDL